MINGYTTPPATPAHNYDNAPAYNEAASTTKLKSIRHIFDLEERASQLQSFIDEEENILGLLNPPGLTSHALNIARSLLNTILNPEPFFPPAHLPDFPPLPPAARPLTPRPVETVCHVVTPSPLGRQG